MNKTVDPLLCNCSTDAPADCRLQLARLLNRLNSQMTNEYRSRPEHLANADLYSIVILCLFAAIIIVIMIRAIKPSESLDDQVTIILSSMRARCEYEDDFRHKMQLRKAKLKAKRWLQEAKMRSTFQIRKLSFNRSRSTEPTSSSVKSQVLPRVTTPMKVPCHRAKSIQFLPAIVVTTTKHDETENRAKDSEPDSSPQSSTHQFSSRASSTQSLDDLMSQESYTLDPFMTV